MKSVILVDDEILVRVGLKSLLNWEEMGFNIVGEFGDANAAIHFLKDNPVRFILTDLYMKPGSGFELIEWIRVNLPESGIIVLSCHNEFDDVQKAMRLGADDYIFKLSLNQNEILDVLKRVESKRTQFSSQLPIEVINNQIIKKDELTNYIKLNITEKTTFTNVMALTYYQNDLIEPLRALLVENGFTDLHFIYDNKYLIFCFKNLSTDILTTIKQIKEISEKYISGLLICGISTDESLNKDNIETAIKNAITATSQCFYDTTEICFFYNDYILRKDTFYTDLVNEHFFVRYNELKVSINTNNFVVIDDTIKNLFSILKKVAPPVIETTRHYIMDILTTLRTKLYTHKILLSKIEEDNENSLLAIIMHGQTLNIIEKRFFMFLELYKEKIINSCIKIRPDIEAAMRYIYENCTKGISLSDIADNSNMNSSYFSHIFKKETGTSVIDYLHEVQIEKAKEYLLSDKYMVYEVAELIGMQNANYFSTLFKKVTGKSPQEYITGKNL
ncbi:MAG: response regulator [Spirochaetaceae bacterium]